MTLPDDDNQRLLTCVAIAAGKNDYYLKCFTSGGQTLWMPDAKHGFRYSTRMSTWRKPCSARALAPLFSTPPQLIQFKRSWRRRERERNRIEFVVQQHSSAKNSVSKGVICHLLPGSDVCVSAAVTWDNTVINGTHSFWLKGTVECCPEMLNKV